MPMSPSIQSNFKFHLSRHEGIAFTVALDTTIILAPMTQTSTIVGNESLDDNGTWKNIRKDSIA